MRVYVSGKEKWKALKTDVFTVAQLRMGEHKREATKNRNASEAVESGKATMGQLADAYLARVDANEDLKVTSKAARRHAVARVRRTWPGFDDLTPKQITLHAVIDWTIRLKREGTDFTPPGARRSLRGNSATSINTAVDGLRRILDVAVERGLIYANAARAKPPEGRLKKKIAPKLVQLPRLAEFLALFDEVETGSGQAGWGMECADFCRFLVFSGARKSEAAAVTWSHVDWAKNQITIPGTKSESSQRIVPIFPELADLLRKIHDRRAVAAEFAIGGTPHVPPHEKILRVGEAQKSIDRACAKLKLPRITHHDFRHAFATIAIESGVDIPTVARWLGHADGGALLMKTYSHLRDDHSQEQAKKLARGGAA